MKTLIYSMVAVSFLAFGFLAHAEEEEIEWRCLPTDKPKIAHTDAKSCKNYSNSAFDKAGCEVNESETKCEPETADDIKERTEGDDDSLNKKICKSQGYAFQDHDDTAKKNSTSNKEGQATGASQKEAKCLKILNAVRGWKCKTKATNCTSAHFDKDTGEPKCGEGKQVVKVKQDLNSADQSVPVAFCKEGGGGGGKGTYQGGVNDTKR